MSAADQDPVENKTVRSNSGLIVPVFSGTPVSTYHRWKGQLEAAVKFALARAVERKTTADLSPICNAVIASMEGEANRWLLSGEPLQFLVKDQWDEFWKVA